MMPPAAPEPVAPEPVVPESPRSTTPILDAARAELDRLPKNDVGVGVTIAQGGEPTIVAGGEKDLGKGWFAEGQASWARRAGWAVRAWIGWKGKRE